MEIVSDIAKSKWFYLYLCDLPHIGCLAENVANFCYVRSLIV